MRGRPPTIPPEVREKIEEFLRAGRGVTTTLNFIMDANKGLKISRRSVERVMTALKKAGVSLPRASHGKPKSTGAAANSPRIMRNRTALQLCTSEDPPLPKREAAAKAEISLATLYRLLERLRSDPNWWP